MKCCRCGKQPHEIDEYVVHAQSRDPEICAKWVREEEGTYNPRTDTFACTDCYIRMGSPSSPHGWKAPGELRLPYRSRGVVVDYVLGVRRSLVHKVAF